MANNTAQNVRADAMPSTGAIFIAPAGTALPTDVTTALAAAFVNVGIIGSDGVTLTPSSNSSDIEDMNGNVVLTVESGYKTELGFPMLETTDAALKLYHGTAAVTRTPGVAPAPDLITVQGGAPIFEHVVVVRETVSNGLKARLVAGDAKITAREAVKVAGTAATVRTVTLTLYPMDSDGHTYKEYVQVPAAA